MLKIDAEGSDDDSDPGLNKSATTTPQKINPNEYVAAADTQPIHVNNTMNNAIIGNAGQTPLQTLPKVLPVNSTPYPRYTWCKWIECNLNAFRECFPFTSVHRDLKICAVLTLNSLLDIFLV